MKLTSSVFQQNNPIPKEFTSDGADDSPPLDISEVPPNAKSLALLVEDPDAPHGTFAHWVLFNLPPSERHLEKNMRHGKILPNGARQGINDFKRTGYGGPCPPSGTHRYFFRLFALDTDLKIPEGEATSVRLRREMEGHILADAELMGTYRNQKTPGEGPQLSEKEKKDLKVQEASEESFPASDPPAW